MIMAVWLYLSFRIETFKRNFMQPSFFIDRTFLKMLDVTRKVLVYILEGSLIRVSNCKHKQNFSFLCLAKMSKNLLQQLHHSYAYLVCTLNTNDFISREVFCTYRTKQINSIFIFNKQYRKQIPKDVLFGLYKFCSPLYE
jgi:hypothetical protein